MPRPMIGARRRRYFYSLVTTFCRPGVPVGMWMKSAALDETAREEIARLDAIFLVEIPPMRAVRSYLLLQREPFRGCRLGRLVHEASFEHEELRRSVAAYFEAVRHRLARSLVLAQAEGTCGAGVDPENLALSLAALIHGGYVLARVFRDEELMGRAVEGALALIPGSLNEYKKTTRRRYC